MAGILVCDDDQEIVEAIEIYLKQEGYQVYQAHDGMEALKILKEQEVQLIIMDIMMPKLDGIRATLKIREQNTVPIIILSAKSEDADKILGLNIGADDYLTKPFNPLELVARVKSQLRRYTKFGGSPDLSRAGIYGTGGLVMDDDRKEVTLDGQMIRLTPIEYQILRLLMKNKGRVFSTSQIYEYIWKEDAIGAENTVAVHIRHIREKIEINPKEPRYLKWSGAWVTKWKFYEKRAWLWKNGWDHELEKFWVLSYPVCPLLGWRSVCCGWRRCRLWSRRICCWARGRKIFLRAVRTGIFCGRISSMS